MAEGTAPLMAESRYRIPAAEGHLVSVTAGRMLKLECSCGIDVELKPQSVPLGEIVSLAAMHTGEDEVVEMWAVVER